MYSQTILIGRLGADPEVRSTTGGKDVASLSVSTWTSWFNKDKGTNGEFETQTEWHKVIAWGDQVKQRIVKLKKGDLVMVTGESKTRKFTDAQGIDRWTTEVVGQVKPMPNSHGNASKQQPEAPLPEQPHGQSDGGGTKPEEDDLPF